VEIFKIMLPKSQFRHISIRTIDRFAEQRSDIRACLYLAVGQPEYLSRLGVAVFDVLGPVLVCSY
jgi:hypothetical protein